MDCAISQAALAEIFPACGDRRSGRPDSGIAYEHHAVNFAAVGAQFDHFVDANKMVSSCMAGQLTGGFCLGNGSAVEITVYAYG